MMSESSFSCRAFRLGAPLVHDGFEAVEGAAQGAVVTRHVRHHERQARSEQARVGASEEQGHAQAVGCDAISVGEPPRGQRRRGDAQEGGQRGGHVTLPPAGGHQAKQDEHAEERLDEWIGEGQGRHPLAADPGRAGEAGKRRVSDRTVVADPLDGEQPSIGVKADLPQGGEVRQAFAEPEVAGIVDRRLGPQRPSGRPRSSLALCR